MTLEAIKFKNGKLEILDQLKLPHASEYVELKSVQDGWRAINTMQVRGAPAIAIVGCLSLAVELLSASYRNFKELFDDVEQKLDYLVTARPTAVNMRKSRDALLCWLRNANEAEGGKLVVREIQERLIAEIESMLAKDLSDNRAVGEYGADAILLATNSDRSDASSSASAPSSVSILTHCNTGSLATAGYGTALGVVRSLHARGHLKHVYCTETRPYNQGARLTAYELVYDDIPATLICDSMAASLMKQGRVDAVVTGAILGADQVALNGDTANKIGTYSLAVAANYHKIPFFIALPTTSFNPHQQSGEGIVVEERPAQEMTHVNGVPVAAPGINCWNPAFDVTPAALITGIITEHGVFKPEQMKSFCPANESSLLCDD